MNELAAEWRREASRTAEAEFGDYCASHLEGVARTAWRPVSEPPTERDDWEREVCLRVDGMTVCMDAWRVNWERTAADKEWHRAKWAFVDEVMLMPPED